jgi:hypothetical protein
MPRGSGLSRRVVAVVETLCSDHADYRFNVSGVFRARFMARENDVAAAMSRMGVGRVSLTASQTFVT